MNCELLAIDNCRAQRFELKCLKGTKMHLLKTKKCINKFKSDP